MRATTPSIRRKLTAIIMLTTTCALLMATIGSVLADLSAFRSKQSSDLTTLANVIGSNASASLLFSDPQSAKDVLQALRAKPSVLGACIYTKQGNVFATYGALAPSAVPVVMNDQVVFRSGMTQIFQSIRLDGEMLGTIYIVCDRREANAQIVRNFQIGLVILLSSLLMAFVVSSRLQRSISDPIVELARVANVVTRDNNFRVRATHPGANEGDEIGRLMAGFNGMLAGIEQRDRSLLLHQTHLEETVSLRTRELLTVNGQLLVAKDAAEKVAELNAQLARESALILNSATDGIVGVGFDGLATFLNPAAARILGTTLSEMEGRSIHSVFHHSRPDGMPSPEAECPTAQAIRRGESYATDDDTFWRADGSGFPVEYSATPMIDEDGTRRGAVLTFRDVTERRAVERMKSEFVSTVSHELRTPLTSIRGALSLLSSGMLGNVEEKGQRMLKIAVSNTDRLVRLINDILDLERIESGKIELERGPVDAGTVMLEALEGVQAIADHAHVRLALAPSRGAIWGDSDRIIQTLTNLLGNAIKFSQPDTTVTLSGVARETDFLFCVSDHGRGVPEEKFETIFERFSQVDGSDSREKGGSGLGLAICRSIVNAHGGRIWAEKNDPVGSRLQFTIPLDATSIAARPSIEPITAVMRQKHDPSIEPFILVVEDDLDLARVMITALRDRGISTLHAMTGGDAIQMCRQQEPGLIVLDLHLPDIDGFAVVLSLREDANLAGVPLLVYSAEDVGNDDQSRLRLGPTEFLTKSRASLVDFERCVVRLLGTVTTRTSAQPHAA